MGVVSEILNQAKDGSQCLAGLGFVSPGWPSFENILPEGIPLELEMNRSAIILITAPVFVSAAQSLMNANKLRVLPTTAGSYPLALP